MITLNSRVPDPVQKKGHGSTKQNPTTNKP